MAAPLDPLMLRTLDAIHLASALSLSIEAFVTYDARLAAAPADAGSRSCLPEPEGA